MAVCYFARTSKQLWLQCIYLVLQAHVLLHILRSSPQCRSLPSKHEEVDQIMPFTDLEAHIAESYKMVSALYGPFKSKATEQVPKTWTPCLVLSGALVITDYLLVIKNINQHVELSAATKENLVVHSEMLVSEYGAHTSTSVMEHLLLLSLIDVCL